MTDRSDRAGGDGVRSEALALASKIDFGGDLDPDGGWAIRKRTTEVLRALASPPSGNAGEGAEPVAWRVRFADGRCTSWFDGKPPNHHGPYEFAYVAPPQPAPDAVREAAKPFIAWLDWYDNLPLMQRRKDSDWAFCTMTPTGPEITYGQLRALKAALSTPLPSGEPPSDPNAESRKVGESFGKAITDAGIGRG